MVKFNLIDICCWLQHHDVLDSEVNYLFCHGICGRRFASQ